MPGVSMIGVGETVSAVVFNFYLLTINTFFMACESLKIEVFSEGGDGGVKATTTLRLL